MTSFIIIFIGLASAVMILGPWAWRVSKDNADLNDMITQCHLDISQILSDRDRYKLAAEFTSDGLIVQDMRGRVLWCNAAYCNVLGVTSDDIIGRNPMEFAVPPDQRLSKAEIAAFEYDPADPTWDRLQLFPNQRSNGEIFWNQISVSFHRSNDAKEYAILVCRDVTDQVEKESTLKKISAQLEHEATHDELTGLPNRTAFLSFIDTALQDALQGTVGLLHVDLDNFKDINDTHGHSAGDAVLCHAAYTLRNNLRQSDMVARIGGDEFVVVCPNSSDLEYLNSVGQRLIEAINTPFGWSGFQLQIGASIGASQAAPGETNGDKLLIKADFALYEAKNAGRNRIELYDRVLHDRHAAQIKMTQELANSVASGAFEYAFQPVIDMQTGDIAGFETLVRKGPTTDRGAMMPADFIPIVEDIGLLGELDMLSMSNAIKMKKALNSAGLSDKRMSFNASPDLLARPDFLSRLLWGVETAGIDKSQITIEVLETTDFGDAAETSSQAAVIRDLRNEGFQVFLDDFGVGFAGLSHLAALQVSGVKIDQSLVAKMLTDPVSSKIVQKTIELCVDLGIVVIAEGVEDDATAQVLHEMGCSFLQGYWLSRPIASHDVGAWLIEREQHNKSA